VQRLSRKCPALRLKAKTPLVRTPAQTIPWAWLGGYSLLLGSRGSLGSQVLVSPLNFHKIFQLRQTPQMALRSLELSLNITSSTRSPDNKLNNRSSLRHNSRAFQVQKVSGNNGLKLVKDPPMTLKTLSPKLPLTYLFHRP
jgi:hypothetical protein